MEQGRGRKKETVGIYRHWHFMFIETEQHLDGVRQADANQAVIGPAIRQDCITGPKPRTVGRPLGSGPSGG
jgi:hypothetical protein